MGRWIAQQRIEHRQVITEGFAASRRRNDDDITTSEGIFSRRGLMAVEAADPTCAQNVNQCWVKRWGKWTRDRRPRRDRAPGHHVGHKVGITPQVGKKFRERHNYLAKLRLKLMNRIRV